MELSASRASSSSPTGSGGAITKAKSGQYVRFVTISLGLYLLVGGTLSLLGWVLNIPQLADWDNNGLKTQPNTTIAAIFTGAAILLTIQGMIRFSRILALLIALIGITALFQNLTALDLGINSLLMFDRPWGRAGVIIPGLMGIPGSVSWTLLGSSLWLASLNDKSRIQESLPRLPVALLTLGLCVLAISSLSIIGYLYQVEPLYTLPRLTAIALQTSTFIFAASAALLLVSPRSIARSVIEDDGPAGTILRRVFPFVVLGPVIVGYVTMTGGNAGLYDVAFGTAIRTVVEIGLFVTILGLAVKAIRRQTVIAGQFEREAAEKGYRFTKAFDASPMAVTITSLKTGQLIEVNDAFVDVTGYSKAEAIGKTTSELAIWAEPDERQAELATVTASGSIRNQEYRFRTRHGEILTGLLSAELIDVDGEPCALTVIQDITDRLKAEEILGQQMTLIELSYEPIFSWDSDNRITSWNKGCEALYGYSGEEAIGNKAFELLRTERSASFIDVRDHLDQNGIWEGFLTNKTKQGQAVLVETRMQLIEVKGGRLVLETGRDVTERRRIETKLLEIEQRSRLAQEAGRVGIWDWNAVTNETYWSDTMWELYGEIPLSSDPNNDFWKEHIHADDLERVNSSLSAMLNSKANEYLDEFRIVTKSGETRWIEVRSTVVRDASETVIRMYGVNLDITETKATEDRIRQSESRIRSITNSIPALIAQVGADNNFQFINTKFIEWFGRRSGNIANQSIERVFGKQVFTLLKPSIDEVLSGKQASFELAMKFPEAGNRFVQFTLTPDLSKGDGIDSYFLLVNDLTERKNAEDELRRSEEKMRVLLWCLTEHAILSVDKAGIIEAWNRGAELIFGFTKDEVIGQKIESLFTPEDRADGIHLQEMKRSVEMGHAADDRWHLRKDGSRFFASGEMTCVEVGGEIIGFAKIVRDLTGAKQMSDELKRAHDELEKRVITRTQELAKSNSSLVQEIEVRKQAELNRIELIQQLLTIQEDERGRIARDLHDQLGQRLTALRLKIASLRLLCKDDPEVAALIDRIQTVSELLDSEVSFLAWELRPAILDSMPFAEAMDNYLSEWSRQAEIFAEFDAIGTRELALGKEIENNLYRITQEALNNAAKHAKATQINVLLERRDDNVMLIIEDNGVGFDPKIIGPGDDKNRGFGLFGMRERASMIAASIEIESNIGSGTSIFVKVPLP